MRYHDTDSRWYDQTVAEVWFKDAAAAEAAGFTAPGDASTDSAESADAEDSEDDAKA